MNLGATSGTTSPSSDHGVPKEIAVGLLSANDYLTKQRIKDINSARQVITCLECETRSAKIVRLPHVVYD